MFESIPVVNPASIFFVNANRPHTKSLNFVGLDTQTRLATGSRYATVNPSSGHRLVISHQKQSPGHGFQLWTAAFHGIWVLNYRAPKPSSQNPPTFTCRK
ncbi:hypothetical protein Zmor_009312 [Zophobas morio]|uniref:Uncharacterized protein n=1 Tax=Zophobas morio TaxID=2755281 RepID=A0AA38MHC3_9CUCU|nr:hypothetical protein Zmor_009091 [Zophobas morio]KAJ3657516.1 hypothetical protein Zmor_009312 [Zophobas morio]